MTIRSDEDELLLLCSLRYALASQGDIAHFVTRKLALLWPSLSLESKNTIHSEINRAIDRRRIHSRDTPIWQPILDKPLTKKTETVCD